MAALVLALAFTTIREDVAPLVLPPIQRVAPGMTKPQVDRMLGENPILGIVYGPGYVDWKYGISGVWVLFDNQGRVESVSPGKQVVFVVLPVAPPPRPVER